MDVAPEKCRQSISTSTEMDPRGAYFPHPSPSDGFSTPAPCPPFLKNRPASLSMPILENATCQSELSIDS